uniref:glycine cleavage T C-terminal barrel domain-containing protein n=1 Tax=Metapseudomonas resinovorans TaxID=53412 RepID=UPI00048B529F
AEVLGRLAPDVKKMTFMQFGRVRLEGVECYISRSGYTGEDGYEISVPVAQAEALARTLLAQPEVQPIGLGARDSLRLEAGLCLYGHDMNTDTTPVDASLIWAISKARRADGSRAGGFPGAERIFAQKQEGVVSKRVGLLPSGRAPVREGTQIVNAEQQVIGQVTSGGFGPSLGGPLAMGTLDSRYTALETEVYALVRGKPLSMRVVKTPFVPQRYYRG